MLRLASLTGFAAGFFLFALEAVGASPTAPLARKVIALAIAMGLLHAGMRFPTLTRTHWRWLGVLGAYAVLNVVCSLFADDRAAAASDAWRQAYLAVSIAVLTLVLDTPRARRAWALVMLGIGGFVAAMIGVLTGQVGGGLSFARAYTNKAIASGRFDVSFNALSFAVVLAAIGVAALPSRRSAKLLAFALIIPASVLSGSRTTLLAVGAVCIFLIMRSLLSHTTPLTRRVAWTFLGILVVATTVRVMVTAIEHPTGNSAVVQNISYSRGYVWAAGAAAFEHAPLFGKGAGAFRDAFHGIRVSAWGVHGIPKSGSFHNAYLSTLAEKGLTGFAAAAMVLAFLLMRIRAFRAPRARFAVDGAVGALAPLWLVAILFRGLGEFGGLLGPANSLTDFMAFGGAALIVASSGALGARRPAVLPAAAPALGVPLSLHAQLQGTNA